MNGATKLINKSSCNVLEVVFSRVFCLKVDALFMSIEILPNFFSASIIKFLQFSSLDKLD